MSSIYFVKNMKFKKQLTINNFPHKNGVANIKNIMILDRAICIALKS
jgi:hypothetical protein